MVLSKGGEVGVKLMKAQEPGWISVKDRLPEKAGWYLVYYNGRDMAVAFFKGKTWPFDNHYHKITHWMPLPELPKEG